MQVQQNAPRTRRRTRRSVGPPSSGPPKREALPGPLPLTWCLVVGLSSGLYCSEISAMSGVLDEGPHIYKTLIKGKMIQSAEMK